MSATYGKMRASFKPITAREALRIIREHNPEGGNRDSKASGLAIYSQDMKDGKWVVTHQAIAFDEDGNLIDGLHRLKSQVVSGTDQVYLIVYGCSNDTKMVVDGGRTRTMPDRLKIAGEPWVTGTITAACKMMACAPELNSSFLACSNKTHEVLFQAHKDVLLKTAELFGPTIKRHITVSAVYAAFARAMYHVDPEKLRRPIEVLVTGKPENNKEHIIVDMKNRLDGEAEQRYVGEIHRSQRTCGQTAANRVYCVAQTYIDKYLKGEKPRKVRITTEDLFPLPKEKVILIPNRMPLIQDVKESLEKALV